MTIIELDYMFIYHIEGKEDPSVTTVEKGKIPFVPEGYAVERINKQVYDEFKKLRRIVKVKLEHIR